MKLKVFLNPLNFPGNSIGGIQLGRPRPLNGDNYRDNYRVFWLIGYRQ